MFERCVKTLLLVSITGLAQVSPVFAASKKQMDETAQYYDDVTAVGSSLTLKEFRKQRDIETQRIRDAIFTIRPALKEERDDMAKRVLNRKVKIFREKNFLDSEFKQGVEELYQKGVARFEQNDYQSCRRDFEVIEELAPDFKLTRNYLRKLAKIAAGDKSLNSSDAMLNDSVLTKYAQLKSEQK